MEKDFAPYEESLELKQLGFDEPCIATHGYLELYINTDDGHLKAPLYQQAFRFFRDKYGLVMVIKPIDDKRLELGYNITKNGLIIKACTTYEEAELDCLRKLIEIVKTK